MSLKRRNVLAWILIAVSAAAWIYSQSVLLESANENPDETIVKQEIDKTTFKISATIEAETEWTASAGDESLIESQLRETWETDSDSPSEDFTILHLLGILSCVFSLILASTAVFFLYAQSPLMGPDGACLSLGFFPLLYGSPLSDPAIRTFTSFLAVVLLLLSLRELWGWFRNHVSLNWCLCRRNRDISRFLPLLSQKVRSGPFSF